MRDFAARSNVSPQKSPRWVVGFFPGQFDCVGKYSAHSAIFFYSSLITSAMSLDLHNGAFSDEEWTLERPLLDMPFLLILAAMFAGGVLVSHNTKRTQDT